MRESRLAALGGAVLVAASVAGALLTWRADVAGAEAAGLDSAGVDAALAYAAAEEQAEIEARTEEFTFGAYVAARDEARTRSAVSDDPVAAAEAGMAELLAERLARGFEPEFVRGSPVETATYDVAARAAALLRQRGVHDDSERSFAQADERDRDRDALLMWNLLLVAGTATAMVVQLPRGDDSESPRGLPTVALAVVTVVTAVATAVATRDGWRATTEERRQATRQSASERALQHVSQRSSRLTQENVEYLRVLLRERVATDAAPRAAPADAEVLRGIAGHWTAVRERLDAAREGSDDDVLAREYRPSVLAREEAARHGRLAGAWSAREQASGTVVALLAVALLLVGLAGVARRRRAALLAAGWVLALYGTARLVTVNLGEPAGTPAAAIEAYADGAVATLRGEPEAAVAALRSAVSADPGYAAAWESLGDAVIGAEGNPADAVEAYRRALPGRSSDVLLNSLAYAELLAGDLDAAARHAAEAAALRPDDITIASTVAEVRAARGDAAGADEAARALLARFAREPASTRDAFTSAWRRDRAAMDRAGVRGADALFDLLARASATVAAYGDPRPREPGCVAGRPALTYDAARSRLAFSVPCAGGAARVTVRAFRDGTELEATTTIAVRGGRATGHVPVDPGEHTVETYVDGVLVFAAQVTTG